MRGVARADGGAAPEPKSSSNAASVRRAARRGITWLGVSAFIPRRSNSGSLAILAAIRPRLVARQQQLGGTMSVRPPND